MKAKHIATAAVYGVTGRRVGTRYLYSAADVSAARLEYERYGMPFTLRWRNEDCRLALQHTGEA